MTEQHEVTWTQRDYDCAQAVLAGLGDPELALPTLTDEAIVALDGINREQMTALPWLDEHSEHKELACDEITGVMALRRTGERFITAELNKDSGPVWFYGYIHGAVVLEEFELQAKAVLEGALGVTSITGVSLDKSAFANYTLYSKADYLVALTSRLGGDTVHLDLTRVAASTAHQGVTELVKKGLS